MEVLSIQSESLLETEIKRTLHEKSSPALEMYYYVALDPGHQLPSLPQLSLRLKLFFESKKRKLGAARPASCLALFNVKVERPKSLSIYYQVRINSDAIRSTLNDLLGTKMTLGLKFPTLSQFTKLSQSFQYTYSEPIKKSK